MSLEEVIEGQKQTAFEMAKYYRRDFRKLLARLLISVIDTKSQHAFACLRKIQDLYGHIPFDELGASKKPRLVVLKGLLSKLNDAMDDLFKSHRRSAVLRIEDYVTAITCVEALPWRLRPYVIETFPETKYRTIDTLTMIDAINVYGLAYANNWIRSYGEAYKVLEAFRILHDKALPYNLGFQPLFIINELLPLLEDSMHGRLKAGKPTERIVWEYSAAIRCVWNLYEDNIKGVVDKIRSFPECRHFQLEVTGFDGKPGLIPSEG